MHCRSTTAARSTRATAASSRRRRASEVRRLPPSRTMNRTSPSLAAVLCAAVLAGCAGTTRLDAPWVDAQAPSPALRGQRVLVACEAYDITIQQLCQDQLAAEVTARGATAISAPQ